MTQKSKTKKPNNKNNKKPAGKEIASKPLTKKISGYFEWLSFSDFAAAKNFLFFLILYVPIQWLFLYRGAVEEAILMVYTLIMIGGGIYLIYGFIKYLAQQADSHTGKYGSLLVVYLYNLLLPLIGFKYFGYVIEQLLPTRAEHKLLPKILCDFYNTIEALYFRVLEFPQVIDILIIGSFAIFVLAAVISVGWKKSSTAK